MTPPSCVYTQGSSLPVLVSNRREVLSMELLRAVLPSGEKMQLLTRNSWPLSSDVCWPVWMSYSLTVESSQQHMMLLPSGWKATPLNGLWARIIMRRECALTRNTRAVLSREQVASILPSVEKATPVTHSPWSRITYSSCALSVSHSRAVQSTEAVASCVPSGLKATLVTPSSCPSKIATCWPVLASHRRAVESMDPDATWRLSDENATDRTDAAWPLITAIRLGQSTKGLPSSRVMGLL
mmetsp:Transcript_529/g.1149  ORF Transcript_529/g.1149 Transcript_529/m.1149 type:complete len:240 (-) Transcript_529:619-1338(-)